MEMEHHNTKSAKTGDHIRVLSSELKAKEFICSHCSESSKAVCYRCLTCHDVFFCGGCHDVASAGHAGHGFERIDAATRVAKLRAHGPTDDCPDSLWWCSVPRTGCPTCFGQRPDLIIDLPTTVVKGSRRSRDSWSSLHDLFPSDFEVSSMAGCQLCSLVHESLTKLGSTCFDPSAKVILSVGPEQIGLRLPGNTTPLVDAIIRPRFAHRKLWRTMISAPQFPRNFASPAGFETLRGWLADCRRKHEHSRCQQIRETRLGPGRLLYVGQDLDSKELKLISTNNQRHPYIALTHCWGADDFARTTMANVNIFYQGFDKAILPQTFKDATLCAQSVGVEYVWIDALCIIQGDVADWQKESANMRDIYSNAVLVVVADSGPNAAAGFLGTRLPQYAGISVELHEGNDTHEFLVQRKMRHHRGHTASRAWCLQEMVLARRCVIFNQDEMRWECNSVVTCECKGNRRPFVVDEDVRCPYADFIGHHLLGMTTLSACGTVTGDAMSQGFLPSSAPAQRPFQDLASAVVVYNDWRLRVVNTFTRMQLTRQTDRLPALSGFASLLGERLDNRYLAGVWLADLPLGFLWYVDHNTSNGLTSAPTQYYGPTFSWVSVDGLAKYAYLNRVIEGKSTFTSKIQSVQDASCYTPGLNRYGEVTGGHIRLTGLMTPAVLTRSVGSTPGHDLEVELYGFDSHNSTFVQDTALAAIKVCHGSGMPVMTVARTTQAVHESFSIAVDVLLVGETSLYTDYSMATYALLVLGLSPTKPDAYERLGILQVRMDENVAAGRVWPDSFDRREITLV